MVSIVCMTRGVEAQFEQWKKFMGSQMFPWKRKNLKVCKCGHPPEEHDEKEGCKIKKCPCLKFEPREEIMRVAGTLRPIQLFEYVIPADGIPTFLTMQGTLPTSFLHGAKLRKETELIGWAIRKGMGLKKMPTYSKEEFDEALKNCYQYVPMDGMAVYPLGIKEDKFGPIDFGSEGKFDQEWL